MISFVGIVYCELISFDLYILSISPVSEQNTQWSFIQFKLVYSSLIYVECLHASAYRKIYLIVAICKSYDYYNCIYSIFYCYNSISSIIVPHLLGAVPRSVAGLLRQIKVVGYSIANRHWIRIIGQPVIWFRQLVKCKIFLYIKHFLLSSMFCLIRQFYVWFHECLYLRK